MCSCPKRQSINYLFFRYGASLRIRSCTPLPWTSDISTNNAFTRAGFLRRKWLLPWRVRISLPVPVTLKRLDVALCVLILLMIYVLPSPVRTEIESGQPQLLVG